MGKSTPDNLKPSPMTYEVVHVPSFHHTRARLAAEAEGLTVDELKTRAAGAQFDLSGASTRDEIISAVQQQARGTTPETENT